MQLCNLEEQSSPCRGQFSVAAVVAEIDCVAGIMLLLSFFFFLKMCLLSPHLLLLSIPSLKRHLFWASLVVCLYSVAAARNSLGFFSF